MKRKELGANLPAGAEIVAPDDEHLKMMREVSRKAAYALWDTLEQKGGSQREALNLVEWCLANVEEVMVKRVTEMPASVANQIALWNLLATVTLRVMQNNPLYDSPALTAQLKHQLEVTLAESPGVIIERGAKATRRTV